MSPRAPDRAPASVGQVSVEHFVLAELAAMLARLAELGDPGRDDSCRAVSDRERIDRIALLEQIKAAAAGSQVTEIVRFGQSQVEAQRAAGVHPRVVGRGVADQIALACKISPTAGSRRLAMARALHFDLPATDAALRHGRVSEWVATLVSRETAHLDARARRHVDAQLAGQDLDALSPRRAAAAARRLAYLADPVAAVERCRVAEKERRVTIRPAPDTMAILTAYLPAAQGVAAWAALGQQADAHIARGGTRTRGQVMADTLVELVTGQTRAADVNVEIGVLLPLETLSGPDGHRPAELLDYGPLPAATVREMIRHSQGKLFLTRLFTAPTGQIVGGDERRRLFPRPLARLLIARDRHCRDPYCDAPIRQMDHIVRHSDNGTTTLANGRGLCARGNYVREMPGWQARLVSNGDGLQPHTVAVTTPTGHTYSSQAPQPP